MTHRSRGFSLIELLLVVAIILIIAAIAIPNLLKARIAANESNAVASLRTINTGQATYITTYKRGYAATLAALGPDPGGGPPSSTAAAIIDSVLASALKNGYGFGRGAPGCAAQGTPFTGDGKFTNPNQDGNGDNLDYNITAGPIICGRTGQRTFWTDESGVIRSNPSGACTGPGDPACLPIPPG